MKITFTLVHKTNNYRTYHSSQTNNHDRKLFDHLYEECYGVPRHRGWTKISTTSYRMGHIDVNLSEMAQRLREQGWCVYYWRDKQGIESDDYNTQINYGLQEGLIFGIYCPNLTAWLLTNT